MKQQSNLVYGINPVLEAIASGKTIEKIFLDQKASGANYQPILKLIQEKGLPYSRVPTIKLNKWITNGHQGIIAQLSPITWSDLNTIIQTTYEAAETPLLLVLDGVTDVGNLGAIIRTAVCMGVHALVLPLYNSATLGNGATKTSSGGIFHLPICKTPHLPNTIKDLQANGIQVIACHEKAQKNLKKFDLNLPTALLLGGEDKGISPQTLQYVDHHASIAMKGPIRSLNVSVAAGIFLYEAFCQKS